MTRPAGRLDRPALNGAKERSANDYCNHERQTWFERAMTTHAGLGALDPQQVTAATHAIDVALERVKADPFTEAMEEIARPRKPQA